MGAYVAACWPAELNPPELTALRAGDGRLGGWRGLAAEPGLLVLTSQSAPLTAHVLPQGQGVVLGDLFRRTPLGAPAGRLRLAAPTARGLCAGLRDDYWGRYVAILPDRRTGAPTVFRDPSGALDALIWRQGPVTYLASELPAWLRPRLPAGGALAGSQIAGMLLDPARVAADPGLQGVASPIPGEAWREGRGEVLWRPGAIVAEPGPDNPAEMLVATTDGCVGAYAGRKARVLVEISGGLDSAIVAAAAARAGPGAVRGWLNYHVADEEGDERAYAQRMADRLGVALTEVAKPELPFDPAQLAATAGGARPGLMGVDAHYDEDVARRARKLGARRVLTGQGGDTLFFQMPTPLVAADHLRARGPAGIFSPEVAAVARWTHRSAWAVLRAAIPAAMGLSGAPRRPVPSVLAPDLRRLRLAPHPWLVGCGEAPPAKQVQLAGLVHAQLFHGACARTQAADLVHPLLSQPLVELLLRLPTPALTAGGRDRALARNAFASRLPAAIVERRTKGDLTAYYGRMLAAGLPALRPFLLEGRLAGQGLLDRRRLEARLQADDLIWRGGYGELMGVAAIEAWVRAQDRP